MVKKLSAGVRRTWAQMPASPFCSRGSLLPKVGDHNTKLEFLGGFNNSAYRGGLINELIQQTQVSPPKLEQLIAHF